LTNTFRVQLSEATAPVSEGEYQKVLMADGAPAAVIEIPPIGVCEIIVEGTPGNIVEHGDTEAMFDSPIAPPHIRLRQRPFRIIPHQ
jgi:hypothetical protein